MSILSRLDEEFLRGVRERADYIRGELAGAKGVRGVDGLGLMLGVETEKRAPGRSSPPALRAACWS